MGWTRYFNNQSVSRYSSSFGLGGTNGSSVQPCFSNFTVGRRLQTNGVMLSAPLHRHRWVRPRPSFGGKWKIWTTFLSVSARYEYMRYVVLCGPSQGWRSRPRLGLPSGEPLLSRRGPPRPRGRSDMLVLDFIRAGGRSSLLSRRHEAGRTAQYWAERPLWTDGMFSECRPQNK